MYQTYYAKIHKQNFFSLKEGDVQFKFTQF